MNNKHNRILSFVLAVILVIGILPVGVFADSNVDLNNKEEIKIEDKNEEKENIEKEVKIENPAEEDIKIEEEPEIQPKIIEDAVEISEDSELIEISPVDITDLSAATSLNTAEEVLPTEVLGNKIEKLFIEWIDDPSAETLNLDWKGQGNTPKTARFRISFDLSGQNFYKEGSISMVIPKQIFHDRDGNLIGDMSLAVPELPSKKAAFAYVDLGDKYLITNTKSLSPATGAFIEGTIKGLTPSEIKDKATGYKTDRLSVDFKVDIEDPINEGAVETMGMKSNSIDSEVDTQEKLFSTYKKVDRLFEGHTAIPSELLPENPDEYVYVKWTTYTRVEGNQPFTLDFSDKTSVDKGIEGKILGYMINSSGEIVKNDAFSDSVNSQIFDGYLDGRGYNNFYLTFYTAYPKANMKNHVTYKLQNDVTYTLNASDDKEVTGDSDSAYVNYTPVPYKIPRGEIGILKQGWFIDTPSLNNDEWRNVLWDNPTRKYQGLYSYALNELKEERPVDITYAVYSSAFIHNATLKKGGNKDYAKDYNQTPYTIEINDNEFYFDGRQLSSGDDFEYKTLNILKPEIYSYQKVTEDTEGYYEQDKYDIQYGKIYAGSYGYIREYDDSRLPMLDIFATVNGREIKVATIDYTSGTLNAQTFNGADYLDGRIIFPEGTTTFKVTTTTKESAFRIRTFPTVTIKPSKYISGEISDLFKNSDAPEIFADNAVNFRAYNDNWEGKLYVRGRDILQGFSYGSKLTKKLNGYKNNVEERHLVLDYSLKSTTQTNITNMSTLDTIKEKGLFEDETSQTWYDLLPPGVTVRMDTIKVNKGSVLNKKIITNYKKSGRDLLVVETTSNPKYIYNSKSSSILNVPGLADENILTFQAIYTWEMFSENGGVLDNVAAYESGKDIVGISKSLIGEPDDPSVGNHRDSKLVSSYYDVLKDLNDTHDKPVFTYTKSTDNVYADTWAILSLYKYVSVNNDGSYGDGREEAYAKNVYEGGPYEYRLSIKNPKHAEAKNIVLYDNLENFKPPEFDKYGNKTNNPDVRDTQWRGEFVDIDTRQLERAGANPVIYYSTSTGLDLSWRQNDKEGKNPDLDLSRSDIWTTVKPDNKKITAIAIDISRDKNGNEFILERDASISAFIKMKAPIVKDLANPGEEELWYDTMNDGKFDESGLNGGAHAYNDASVSFNSISESGQISADAFTHNIYTKVGLKPFKIDVEKTFDDDNNRDGIRPEEVKINLIQNKEKVVGSIVLNKDNDFKGSFGYVPYLDEAGLPFSYSVEEVNNEGYRFEYTNKKNDNGLTFKTVNIHEPERIKISGFKKFIGASPVPVIVKLYKNGELYKTQIVNKDNNYNYSFDNLFKFEKGEEINYEVKEEYVPGFITSYDGSDIINTYHPYGNLVIKKELTNDTSESESKVFTLNIEFLDKDGNIDTSIYNYESSYGNKGTVTTGTELRIKKDEVITIKDVKSDGSYKIREVNIPSGFTLDKENSKNLTGGLKAGETINALLVNDYQTSTKFVPDIRKELANKNLNMYQFIFELLDEDMNIIKAGSNNADGKVMFSPLVYTNKDLGKTFVYYIRERDTKKAGYIYDKFLRKITVTPKDNGDGTITANYKYADIDSGEIKSGNTFINEYNAKGTLNLKAFKALVAHELKDGQFEFELYGDKPHGHEGTGDKLSVRAKNNAAGVVDFNINFDEQDIGKTFKFKAKEIAGNDDKMIYDNSEIEYTVTVYDKGNGTLSFDAVAKDLDTTAGNDESTPLFVNRYKNGSLTIEKVIQGSYDGNKVFKFIVKFIGEKEILPDGNIDITRSESAPRVSFTLGEYTKGNEQVEFYETEFDASTAVTGKQLKLPTVTQPGNDVAKYGFSFTNNEKYYDNEIFTNIKYDIDDKGTITKVTAVNSEDKTVDISDKVKANNNMFIQALPSRMMWRNENGIVTIYPENGIVAENNGVKILEEGTNVAKEIPRSISRVKGEGKLLFKGSLSNMFYHNQAIKLDLSSFDTSKVTDMGIITSLII